MKTSVFVLACVLLAGSAFAGRSLSIFTSGSCSAYGSLSITVKHGSCRGFAKAECATFARAQSTIDQTFEAGVTFDVCDRVVVEAKASAVARALAQVYTEAVSKISCDGRGFGCGFSLASGDSFATAYARSFAKAVGAALGENLSAVCVADLESLAAGIAKVAGSSSTKACVNGGGRAASFSEQFTKAVTKVLTDAVATVTAEICDDGQDTAECTADVSGSSLDRTNIVEDRTTFTITSPGTGPFDAPNTAGGSTSSDATATKLKVCEGSDKNCCTSFCFSRTLGPDVSGTHNLLLFKPNGVAACWCH